MPSALTNSGAALQPSDFAPLHLNRMVTGMWSNSNPLRDASTPLYVEKYQGGRQDRIKYGLNTEISSRLTLIRRKGFRVYNSRTWPRINRFYSWNTFSINNEKIRVMVDTAGTVYDGTGPDTQVAVWQKSAGAGSTYFLGVGNLLYFTNGVDNRQLWNAAQWQPNHPYKIGDIVSEAGYLHEAWGIDPAQVSTLQSGLWNNTQNVLTLTTVGGNNPFNLGENVMLRGAYAYTSADGLSGPIAQAGGPYVTVYVPASAGVTSGPVASGGFVASLDRTNGVSGGTNGVFSQLRGGVSIDSNIAWINRGPISQQWGITPPKIPPTISQQQRPSPYKSWQTLALYAFHGASNDRLTIVVNGYAQSALKFDYPFTTGMTEPNWNNTPGGTTPDVSGTFNWQNEGSATWTANTNYVQDHGYARVLLGATWYAFRALTSGTSGPSSPQWLSAIGSRVTDGSMTWINIGNPLTWNDVADRPVWVIDQILDGNGYIQNLIVNGSTGSTTPNWSTVIGGITVEPPTQFYQTAQWQNAGPFSVPATASTQYGYAWKNSVTGDVSNMSPASTTITRSGGAQIIVQGPLSPDPQFDTVVIYRLLQGGSTFLLLDEIPAPIAGDSWTYIDTKTDDAQLNTEIQAQVNGEGTPLPSGATCLEYHLGRPWAAVGNVVYAASGPAAAVSGSSGNAGFNTTFTMQSKVIRLWGNSLGMVVYTLRDAYLIAVDSASGILTTTRWIENLPLLNYDAFTVLLTTPYMFNGNRIVATLDSGAGIVEMSFPIADQVAKIDPSTAYCTFHTGPTGETALYLANGQDRYFRMSPTSAPESGIVWHPMAAPAGGMSAMESTEITPGTRALLMGPASSGPILMRDPSINTDNGTPYEAYADFGSVVLALPGQLAGLAWMTLESTKCGSAPKLGILLNEIDGDFEDVPRTRQDPTNLPPSKSVISNRHSLMQNQNPVWCRHMQYSISWPAEDAPNELLTTTIFGQTWQEQRSQQ